MSKTNKRYHKDYDKTSTKSRKRYQARVLKEFEDRLEIEMLHDYLEVS